MGKGPKAREVTCLVACVLYTALLGRGTEVACWAPGYLSLRIPKDPKDPSRILKRGEKAMGKGPDLIALEANEMP